MKAEHITNFRFQLEQFTGTEHWYRHWAVRSVTYTDGFKFFCDHAGAYWLLDILATELHILQRALGFLHIRVSVIDSKCDLVADDGNDNVVWRKHVSHTDLPEGEWRFYFTGDVLLLPSEY